MKNKENEKRIEQIHDRKIEKTYEKAEQFASYYVTGAIGGFNNKYDFRMGFYNIDTLDHTLQVQHLSPQKLPPEEYIEKISKVKMPHKILCEVVMTEKAAKELHSFLGRQLSLLEKLKEQEENND